MEVNPTIAVAFGMGKDRESARMALLGVVNQDLMGDQLSTNRDYLSFVLQHSDFIAGPTTDSSIKVNIEYLARQSYQNIPNQMEKPTILCEMHF
jgi:hypothetical protein